MKYAKILNSKVENTLVLRDEDVHLMPSDWVLVKSDTANIGDEYANGIFIPPAPVVPVALPKRISLDDIRNALTLAEKIKWDNNKTDEITTVKIEFAMPLLVADAEQWLQLLVDSGSISQESVDKILA
jgi:hypothetical protein